MSSAKRAQYDNAKFLSIPLDLTISFKYGNSEYAIYFHLTNKEIQEEITLAIHYPINIQVH